MYDVLLNINQSCLLSENDLQLIKKKSTDANQLVFAVLLKFFEHTGRFPQKNDSLDDYIREISQQLSSSSLYVKKELFYEETDNRTLRRFRSEICSHHGYEKFSSCNYQLLEKWLKNFIFPKSLSLNLVKDQVYEYFRGQKWEPLTPKKLDRFLRSTYKKFEQELFQSIEKMLPNETKKKLDELLLNDNLEIEEGVENKKEIQFKDLKKEHAELKIESIEKTVQKYQYVNHLKIPQAMEKLGSRRLFEKYYKRVRAELPSEMRSHKPTVRYAYMAMFCFISSQKTTDILADMLLLLIHRMQKRAEQYVDRYILSEVKRVDGKFDTLYLLAQKALDNPLGIIQEEIYPTISQDRLKDIVTDLTHKGKWYTNSVQLKMLSLYSHANRRLIWTLIHALNLDANAADFKDVLKVLSWLKKEQTKKTNKIIIQSKKKSSFQAVLASTWLPIINSFSIPEKPRITLSKSVYELAFFDHLANDLKTKNIWINGSYRYRNPMYDLVNDFENKEEEYLAILSLPKAPEAYIDNIKSILGNYLEKLNKFTPNNPHIAIASRNNKGAIKISPSLPQKAPANLNRVHKEILRRWSPTSLMDVLQETDFRVGFTNQFPSTASRENIESSILKKRLLLCLFGLGTNTGLKNMSNDANQENYSDLRYVKRRYIGSQNLRNAIQSVVDVLLKERDPEIWGTQTTGCAGDSKKIEVWDQNLIAEWHARYKGKGVMVYWHADRKSACIYSQIKTCNSSEVASMIKGALLHDTEMEMNEVYVDTHGQSTVGFALSHLLHFDLLPRLKNISRQKLYTVSKSAQKNYPHLEPALFSTPINWKIIKDNYQEILKLVISLRLRIVEPEVILKRFSSNNYNNPVYKALLELGKAILTIFLCRYLLSEELRIEIHEALNVVERVNSIMGFIFYGKRGEISTNDPEDQELAILALHLLQICITYINTLMIQEVLNEPGSTLKQMLTKEDKRALSPLITSHISPYGLFPLDIGYRLKLKIYPFSKLGSAA